MRVIFDQTGTFLFRSLLLKRSKQVRDTGATTIHSNLETEKMIIDITIHDMTTNGFWHNWIVE